MRPTPRRSSAWTRQSRRREGRRPHRALARGSTTRIIRPDSKKMDFPRYDGKSDPLIFINRCESYFHQQQIMEEEKVWMASYNLEDDAQLWYYQVQQDEGTPSWRHFKELLHLRYGPPLRSNPLGELVACHRTGTVEEYQDRFQALLPRAGRLEEEQRVQLFTAGLLPPLSHDVEIHNPQSLVATMSLARKIELRNSYIAPPTRAPAPGRDRALLPAPAPRLALPAPQRDSAAPTTVTVEGRPVRRLTQVEQEECRRLGLCYNYDEKFGRGHNRMCKRLFLLDGVAEEDVDDEADTEAPGAAEDTPHVSLNAIAGIHFSDTMQIIVKLGGSVLTALLDSGSTHNFIAEAAALRSGLPIQRRPRLTATMANGERVSCPGVL